MNVDLALVSIFNAVAGQSAFLDGLIVFFALYFPYLLTFLFFWTVFRSAHSLKGKWLLLAQGMGAGVIARGLVELIRLFIHRPRPFLDTELTALLSEASFSFPSGHAAFFFALSIVVYLYNKSAGLWFFAGALLIGLARIAAGVHYPSDILGGALLGAAAGYASVKLSRRFFR